MHNVDLKIGDRIIVSKFDEPYRAIIEDITETSISFLAFCAIPEDQIAEPLSQQWRYEANADEDMYVSVFRWTFKNGNGGFFPSILKMHWEFFPYEVKYYKTDDPCTLIKLKKKRKSTKPIVKFFKVENDKWMSENLQVRFFQNGDEVPLITEPKEWKKAAEKGTPACCFYDNNEGEFGTRGLLYNVYAVTDPRGLAPKGWHIPTAAEFSRLIYYHGGSNLAGKHLRDPKGWFDGPFMTASEFKGLPNGCRLKNGKFEGEGYFGQWLMTAGEGEFRYLILRGDAMDALEFKVTEKGTGYSIRCIKDIK